MPPWLFELLPQIASNGWKSPLPSLNRSPWHCTYQATLYLNQGGDVKHRFVRRGFSQCTWEELPERRRVQINLARGSKYYVKMMHEADISSADNNSHGSYALDLPQ